MERGDASWRSKAMTRPGDWRVVQTRLAVMSNSMTMPEGWGILHLFCKLGTGAKAQAITDAVNNSSSGDHQVVPVAIFGHKADIGFMAMGPDLWRLRALQGDLQRAGLDVADSFLSITEISEYAEGVPEPMRQARLYPKFPPEGMAAFCFYPMSKRRSKGANWYRLSFEERLELMHEHGKSGRNFAGRIVQLISASTGLDDYEWGVTLFGRSPIDLKECVYTLRFDEASAVYADFGPFYTGLVAPIEEVLTHVGLD